MTEKLKTDVRMPTQFGPLEGRTVDNPRGGDETGASATLLGNIGESGGEQSPRNMARKGNSVFVLDKHKKPLMPCSNRRARLLLERGRAVVHRRYPFTIRLKDRVGGDVQPVRLKFDPGFTTTGTAIVREAQNDVQHILHLAEIEHRGKIVRKRMLQRAMHRRRRRSANLRYRAKRFDNRRPAKGTLPPSLRSRIGNIVNWTTRYRKLAPLTSLTVEQTTFDTRPGADPNIKLARAAAAMNSMRLRLLALLKRFSLPIEAPEARTTKANRDKLGIQKEHCLDAACAGNVSALLNPQIPILHIKAGGHGKYQRTHSTAYGFPRGYLMRVKRVRGFQTGDMVRAIVAKGKKIGTYVGRTAIRASGRFDIQTPTGVVQGISWKNCTLLSRADGYSYQQETRLFPALQVGVSAVGRH